MIYIYILDGYGGVHGGMGFGTRNAEGEKILEFGDGEMKKECECYEEEVQLYRKTDYKPIIIKWAWWCATHSSRRKTLS